MKRVQRHFFYMTGRNGGENKAVCTELYKSV